ncbi:MAG: LysR family transcriptional regulator [Bdellovibrionales bacterium]|nr:LysR family transcriptional regulator [Bdellovibrionales bacterium]
MNLSHFTLRDLEYIVAVAEHRRFGAAAQACHVSQPALSGQIKKAEDALGFRLFERTNQSVTLTNEGGRFVEQARIVLEEASKLVTLPHSEQATLSGNLRLGAIASLGPYLIPHFLAPLHREAPQLELLLHEGLTENLLQELRIGALDCLLLATGTYDAESLEVFPLLWEPFVLAVPQKHPLSKKKDLRRQDLDSAEMILLEDGHCLADQALDFCPRRRRGNPRRMHATSLETLKQLVAIGTGYTLVPKLAAYPDPRFKNLLRYREFSADRIGRGIDLVCRRRASIARKVELLADFIRNHRPQGLSERT